MARTKKAVEETELSPLLESARKVLLATVGAVVLAQEEIEDFVNKLVERGEIAEKDGRKLVQDVLEKRQQDAKQVRGDLDKRVEKILGRLNIPTKRDIQALNTKINALSKKINELATK